MYIRIVHRVGTTELRNFASRIHGGIKEMIDARFLYPGYSATDSGEEF